MDEKISNFIQTQEPWKRLPLETFFHSTEHRRTGTESDKRIAFILLDNVVELSVKLFLDRKGIKIAEDAKFQDLKSSLQAYSSSMAKLLKLDELSEFHGYRNDLYHKKFGLVPDLAHLEHFENLVKNLIDTVYKVDLDNIPNPIDISNPKPGELIIWELLGMLDDEQKKELKLKRIGQQIADRLEFLKPEIELAIEKVNQDVLLPSFKKRIMGLQEISMHLNTNRDDYNEKIVLNDEWINAFFDIMHDVTGDTVLKNYAEFRQELQQEIVEAEDDSGKPDWFLDDDSPNTDFWQLVVDDPFLLYLLIIENVKEMKGLTGNYVLILEIANNPRRLITREIHNENGTITGHEEVDDDETENRLERVEEEIQNMISQMREIYGHG